MVSTLDIGVLICHVGTMQMGYGRSCDKVTPHQTHIVGVTLTHFSSEEF